MISYNVQNALDRKADSWKVQNLENEIHSLKRTVGDLEQNLARKQNQIDNLNEVVRRLLEELISQGVAEEGSLEHLRQYL